MSRDTVEAVLLALRRSPVGVLDITGGAPELNPHFRYLVEGAKQTGSHVIVRTNLTVFFEKGLEDLPEFYDRHAVEIVASLPCYSESAVERVRGKGVFQKSVECLLKLNGLGFGTGAAGKRLNLVYNPSDSYLAPPQEILEEDYRRELKGRFGICFDGLYVFVNMPVGRFRDRLVRAGELERYLLMLEAAFNPGTLDGLMCRHQINVGWDGRLYDCDFNQVLGLAADANCPQHVRSFDYMKLSDREMTLGDHCFGCTAGQGST